MILKFSYAPWASVGRGCWAGSKWPLDFIASAPPHVSPLWCAPVGRAPQAPRQRVDAAPVPHRPARACFSTAATGRVFAVPQMVCGQRPRPEYGRWTYWEKFRLLAVFWGVASLAEPDVLWWPTLFTLLLPVGRSTWPPPSYEKRCWPWASSSTCTSFIRTSAREIPHRHRGLHWRRARRGVQADRPGNIGRWGAGRTGSELDAGSQPPGGPKLWRRFWLHGSRHG